MAVNGTHGFESKKKQTYTDKTKLNPAARDDTRTRDEDMKQSVCARNWTVFISYFTSLPEHVDASRAGCCVKSSGHLESVVDQR